MAHLLSYLFLIGGMRCLYDATTLDKANNDFGLKLYNSLAKTDTGNIFFSPLSISTAFSMVLLGSRTTTREELFTSLSLHKAVRRFDDVHDQYKKVVSLFRSSKPTNYSIGFANKALVQVDNPILPSYATALKDYYNTTIDIVDFAENTGPTLKAINDWCNEQTHGMIPTILDNLDPTTKLILLNAIYFKGLWVKKFNATETRAGPFYNNGGQVANDQVMFMNITKDFMHAEMDDHTMVTLPYDGGISMTIILPKERNGLDSIMSKMTLSSFNVNANSMSSKSVQVLLPRFKLETSYDLIDVLVDLGIKEVFTGSADLSGIDGTRSLVVSSVIHKAAVEVDEEGTKAAAVTAISFTRKARQEDPVEFHADHPFAFFIRHSDTGIILFMGRVNAL